MMTMVVKLVIIMVRMVIAMVMITVRYGYLKASDDSHGDDNS